MTLSELLEQDDIVLQGGAIRALRNDDGSESENRFGGLVVPFTGPDEKDSYGTYFDAETYYGARKGDGCDVAINHGFPIRGVVSGQEVTFDEVADRLLKTPIRVSVTDAGLFGEVWFDLADEYEAELAKAGRAGKLYYSSGALSHGRGSKLFKVADDGHVERWIIGEVSVTPTPGTPQQRTQLTSLRSLVSDAPNEQPSIESPEEPMKDEASAVEHQTAAPATIPLRTMVDNPADACYAAYNTCLMAKSIIKTAGSTSEDSAEASVLHAYASLCGTNAYACEDYYYSIYWVTDEALVALTLKACSDAVANVGAVLTACVAFINDTTMQTLCQSAAAACETVAAACASHAGGSTETDATAMRSARESAATSLRSLYSTLPDTVRAAFDVSLRAGAVLNKSNHGDITSIRDLAQGILDRSSKEEEEASRSAEPATPETVPAEVPETPVVPAARTMTTDDLKGILTVN